MARGGINKAVVQKARTALLARGEHPSIDAVRIELGNTGSKTTIHRYLKELEATELARGKAPLGLSEQLANLVNQLAEQMQEEAQASVAEERAALARERLEHQSRLLQAQENIRQLVVQNTDLAEQLQASQEALQQERLQRQNAEVDNARLLQMQADQELRIGERDEQIRLLEGNHQHARDALEHFRQASKEQREQEQRRHEAQVQQMQIELRTLQQSLVVRQDEITQLHRDNARLLAEAQQQRKEWMTQQRQLEERERTLADSQQVLVRAEQDNGVLQERCNALRAEANRLGEKLTAQEQHVRGLLERLAEANTQLKSVGHVPPKHEGEASQS
ncbi:DNA-binding protein [Pseudomonas sp. CR3202]|uniref:DNA-binding protein n=1 Tax=Pseudomonas sp. CR3202 TaxID=3351532 RepID=UPI003BF1F471